MAGSRGCSPRWCRRSARGITWPRAGMAKCSRWKPTVTAPRENAPGSPLPPTSRCASVPGSVSLTKCGLTTLTPSRRAWRTGRLTATCATSRDTGTTAWRRERSSVLVEWSRHCAAASRSWSPTARTCNWHPEFASIAGSTSTRCRRGSRTWCAKRASTCCA